jgi:hypothetical protein
VETFVQKREWSEKEVRELGYKGDAIEGEI